MLTRRNMKARLDPTSRMEWITCWGWAGSIAPRSANATVRTRTAIQHSIRAELTPYVPTRRIGALRGAGTTLRFSERLIGALPFATHADPCYTRSGSADTARAIGRVTTMIHLKPVAADDAGVIFDAWGRYPQNFEYLTARAFATIANASAYIEGLFQTPDSLAFHIVTDSGVVGIVKASVVGHRAQIGYVVHEPHAGRGLATAAVREIVTRLEAIRTLSRIWATCALDNLASARVLEKCGFEREAVLKNWVTYPAQGGRAFDNYSYVRIPGGSRVRPDREA